MRAPFSGCGGLVFRAGRHQARHFGLGDVEFLAAVIGEFDVGDGVIGEAVISALGLADAASLAEPRESAQ